VPRAEVSGGESVEVETMKIAVIGVGGVGGYFGGRLAKRGEEVWFVARGRTLDALRSDGLHVSSVKGDFFLPRVRAVESAADIGTADAVIVAVKAWQVEEAAQAIRPAVGDRTVVLPLENGVEAADQLAAVLGREHILGGLCTIISRQVAPGRIEHAGAEPTIALGELDGGQSTRAERLAATLEGAGITVQRPEDIHAALWRKFLFISSFSGVGAVTRAGAGAIRSIPATRRLLEGALGEVRELARARGVALPGDVVAQTMAFIDSLPEGGTASMQRDVLEGRPSELDSQNGAVVRLGRESGVPTPIHGYIYASLLPAERAARS
jgi:2-dehydropantoate 2-reductase